MKSITDATWKDAAIIEVRSLIARLETSCTQLGKTRPGSQGTESIDVSGELRVLNSITRQAVKLAETIDHIEEATPETKRAYWIDPKEDGTWLIIKGARYSAMFKLEAISRMSTTDAGIAELRETLLKGRA